MQALVIEYADQGVARADVVLGCVSQNMDLNIKRDKGNQPEFVHLFAKCFRQVTVRLRMRPGTECMYAKQ